MNSASREPQSCSMASLTVREVVSGPGVSRYGSCRESVMVRDPPLPDGCFRRRYVWNPAGRAPGDAPARIPQTSRGPYEFVGRCWSSSACPRASLAPDPESIRVVRRAEAGPGPYRAAGDLDL